MNKFWLFSLISIAISSFIMGWFRTEGSSEGNDTRRLLEAVIPYMQQGSQLTFKYTSSYGSCENPEELLQAGVALSQKLELPVSSKLEQTLNHLIYASIEQEGKGNTVSLKLIKLEEPPSCYMVLERQTTKVSNKEEFTQWQDQMGAKLAEFGIEGQWNVMVQGELGGNKLAIEPESVIKQVSTKLRGKILETYMDQGTVSYSLASDQLAGSVASGNHKVNAQVALHQESTTGQWRLTIGSPLITMEY
jgi:hypothetical protein